MKVTYIFTTDSNIIPDNNANLGVQYPLTPRIMTKILNAQKKIKVHYSNLPLLVNISYLKYMQKSGTNFEEFHKLFIKSIDYQAMHETVLLTLGNPFEILFAVELLNRGKKLVVGGSITKIFDLKVLRDIIKYNGGKNLENLLIVRPYINETVDLYQVIKNWQDIDLDVSFDTSNMYIDSTDDFYKDFIPVYKKNGIGLTPFLPIYFSNECRWKKCTFCRYCSTEPETKFFIRKDNLEESFKNCLRILVENNLEAFMFYDPEFYFTEINLKLVEYFRKYKKSCGFFTSIRLLKSNKYWKHVVDNSDVIKTLMVGTETLDNFGLKLLNKGCTWQDTFEVNNKIIEHNKNSSGGRQIGVIHCIMQNLATKNEQNVKDSYSRLNEMVNKLKGSGTKFYMSPSEFNCTPLIDYTTNNPYLKLLVHPYKINNKYKRIDENGSVMRLDKEIVDPEIYKNIFPSQMVRW